MNQISAPPYDKTGRRADSPMREEARLSTEVPLNGHISHGLPTPANDVPSSGFTAVNGDSHLYPSFRPDESARPPVAMTNGDHRPQDRPAPYPGPGAYPNHGWQPDERRPDEVDINRARPESPGLGKRKRADSRSNGAREDARDEFQYSRGYQSPKRRMMVLNSGGIGATEKLAEARSFSDGGGDLPEATTGTYERDPTPTARWDNASPPPQPRPEVEAELAKAAQAFAATDKAPLPAQHSASPPDDDRYDRSRSQQYTPEAGDAQAGDSSDPKKRKRNFSNRTKTGCHTCRSRKKKCDEGKPICENCKRGAFECGGYGPKPPGGAKISAARTNLHIQSKPQYEAPQPFYDARHHRPPSPRPPPHWDAVRPDPYSAPYRYAQPGPMDARPPSSRDSWAGRPPAWAGPEHPQYMHERLPPPVELAGIPPPPPPGHIHSYPHDPRGPPPGAWAQPPSLPHYRAPPGPPTVISSRESVTTSHSGHATSLPGFPSHGPPTDRTKMMTGQPYRHFIDDELIRDRQSCRRAVESYNQACAASSTASDAEKVRHFRSIRDPRARTFSETMVTTWQGPTGTCGSRTIVESPFTCEYGYNVNLGNDVVIQANCVMQDACTISIGDRTIVGPNVKFYCMTASVDSGLRKGSQGMFLAGAIKVEEDCFIGADVIIMPFRTIGKGAVVGAGSVVTKDVAPFTIVAGNPAKPVRKRIEPGPNVDNHDHDIQEQNEKMIQLMKENRVATTRDGILQSA
ncbi:Putative acetyltransferase [Fulvia fulva]|uniref:Acetyltransferase n=1 Tax=Passalora fulva TaxID=5499 RepID=A0A9Q8PL11_PASFU|nr:Putative acetyltransferase [Fulvia fulva]UJO24376.1 Putative acetyltransferase [Fulvia fulva]